MGDGVQNALVASTHLGLIFVGRFRCCNDLMLPHNFLQHNPEKPQIPHVPPSVYDEGIPNSFLGGLSWGKGFVGFFCECKKSFLDDELEPGKATTVCGT